MVSELSVATKSPLLLQLHLLLLAALNMTRTNDVCTVLSPTTFICNCSIVIFRIRFSFLDHSYFSAEEGYWSFKRNFLLFFQMQPNPSNSILHNVSQKRGKFPMLAESKVTGAILCLYQMLKSYQN